jgi:hypothetical protein
MATSGTTAFNLDILEIIEEAYERAGIEIRTGYELRTAKRSLQLLALEWSNMGINLWTVKEATIAMVDGTATYSLASDIIDVIEGVMRKGTGTSQVDYNLTRMSVSTYAQRTSKNTESRPTEYYVDRQLSPTVTFWPVGHSSIGISEGSKMRGPILILMMFQIVFFLLWLLGLHTISP